MSWEVDADARKRIDAIAHALADGDRLYLATDPDREGEAISWHVQEVLRQRGALEGVDVKRVVFHEVTKNAVLDAMARPHALNPELLEAYLETGRASCRERVCQYVETSVVAVYLKKKK